MVVGTKDLETIVSRIEQLLHKVIDHKVPETELLATQGALDSSTFECALQLSLDQSSLMTQSLSLF